MHPSYPINLAIIKIKQGVNTIFQTGVSINGGSQASAHVASSMTKTRKVISRFMVDSFIQMPACMRLSCYHESFSYRHIYDHNSPCTNPNSHNIQYPTFLTGATPGNEVAYWDFRLPTQLMVNARCLSRIWISSTKNSADYTKKK